MTPLGLSSEQLAERKLRLHAGDAASIMAGDYRSVFARFQPGYVPDDLSGEFRVQLGSYTEPFGLYWTEKMIGREVTYYSDNELCCHIWRALTGRDALPELVVSKRYPFMACNLDSVTLTPQGQRAVLDAKHLGRAGEAETLRYTPAGTWQATCAGTDWWGIAPIVGNKWEPPILQAVDPIYQATMIARAKECWSWIKRGEEPPEAETPVLPPKPQPRLREIIVPTDNEEVFEALCRQENWLSEAGPHISHIIGTDAAAKVWAIHREAMKSLVPEDVGKLRWGRYTLSRTKAGSITQAVSKLEGDDI